MAAWLLVAALALSPAPDLPAVPDVPPPAPAQILHVPEPLRAQFRQWNGPDPHPAEARLERLVAFLFDSERGLGLQYQYDANHTVAEVYATRRANCLSFSLMAIALAREAGLEAYGQEIKDVLTWFQDGNTVYRNNHVNAGFRIGHERFSADVASDEVIARQEPRRIDDAHLLALFYNNRAVALLAQGKRAAAHAYLQQALALSDAYAPFWNNAGVLAYRDGQSTVAEHAYRRALDLDPEHSAAMFNLVTLYKRGGRVAEAAPLERRLERLRQRDPFDQFLLALERERAGDYDGAVRHYRRAIRLFGSEHRFHEGLARAYLHRGDARRAGRELERARQLSQGLDQARYQAKIDRLRNRDADHRNLFGPDPSRAPTR